MEQKEDYRIQMSVKRLNGESNVDRDISNQQSGAVHLFCHTDLFIWRKDGGGVKAKIWKIITQIKKLI